MAPAPVLDRTTLFEVIYKRKLSDPTLTVPNSAKAGTWTQVFLKKQYRDFLS